MTIPLYLFAKAPHPGLVMTRLEPQLGPHGAAELAFRLLRKALHTVYHAWPGRVILCVWPDPEDSIFVSLQQDYPVAIERQLEADLGNRMMHSIEQGVELSGAATVVGCDVPDLNAQILYEAHEQLAHGRNVIGPATDGGFYLLGLQQAEHRLFNGVTWGDEQVLARVRQQAAKYDLGLFALPTLRDIDTWPDLLWLIERDPTFAEPAINRAAVDISS